MGRPPPTPRHPRPIAPVSDAELVVCVETEAAARRQCRLAHHHRRGRGRGPPTWRPGSAQARYRNGPRGSSGRWDTRPSHPRSPHLSRPGLHRCSWERRGMAQDNERVPVPGVTRSRLQRESLPMGPLAAQGAGRCLAKCRRISGVFIVLGRTRRPVAPPERCEVVVGVETEAAARRQGRLTHHRPGFARVASRVCPRGIQVPPAWRPRSTQTSYHSGPRGSSG